MLVFTRYLAGQVDQDTAVHTALLFAWPCTFRYLATNVSMSAITLSRSKSPGRWPMA